MPNSAPDPGSLPHPIHSRLPRPAAALWCLFGVAALLAPALWNGWPIVFFDTAGYVRRVLEMDLEPGRSLFYGLFLWAASGGWVTLWGPVLAQAALVLWLVHLLLRTHGLGGDARGAALVAAVLSALTGIGWFTGQLMPDILLPLLVLALWLLGFRWEHLGRGERAGLALLALLGLLSHMSAMALALGLVLVTVAARVLAGWQGWDLRVRPLPVAGVVVASLLLMPLLHLALVGKATYTPGGPVFIFGRLLQDGVVQRWLDAECPRADIRLCAYRDRLPATANDFIWHDDSPFREIGWWGGADAELARIVRESVAAHPGAVLATSLTSTLAQLGEVETGDGLDEWQEVTNWVFRELVPQPGFAAARQQNGQMTQALFDAVNTLHVPVAHLSLAGLVLAAFLAFRRGRADLGALALFLLLALLGNAVISGALANPHDRYQSRMIWIATLALGMAMAAIRRQGTAAHAPK
ncbi:MAG: hypothetical protein RLY86_4345 [Pseudomonadota bacterium]|jgi:hypothetical protein